MDSYYSLSYSCKVVVLSRYYYFFFDFQCIYSVLKMNGTRHFLN